MNRLTGRRLSVPALIAAVFLSGCVTTQGPTSVAEAPRDPAAPAVRGGAPAPLKEIRRTRPLPVALRDPMALRALDPSAVEQLIGPPSFVRHDGGAIIWQYTVRGCVMDLFWYRSDSGLSLLHMEAREVHTPRSAEMRGCLDNLWQARSEHAES